MPVSAYDAFPPSEFNAWVESVRNKIIDGLDTLHDDLEEELARPGPSRQVQVELSENAKKAISLARERQNVIAREAGQTDRTMTSPLQEPPLSSHYHDHNNASSSEQDEEEDRTDPSPYTKSHPSSPYHRSRAQSGSPSRRNDELEVEEEGAYSDEEVLDPALIEFQDEDSEEIQDEDPEEVQDEDLEEIQQDGDLEEEYEEYEESEEEEEERPTPSLDPLFVPNTYASLVPIPEVTSNIQASSSLIGFAQTFESESGTVLAEAVMSSTTIYQGGEEGYEIERSAEYSNEGLTGEAQAGEVLSREDQNREEEDQDQEGLNAEDEDVEMGTDNSRIRSSQSTQSVRSYSDRSVRNDRSDQSEREGSEESETDRFIEQEAERDSQSELESGVEYQDQDGDENESQDEEEEREMEEGREDEVISVQDSSDEDEPPVSDRSNGQNRDQIQNEVNSQSYLPASELDEEEDEIDPSLGSPRSEEQDELEDDEGSRDGVVRTRSEDRGNNSDEDEQAEEHSEDGHEDGSDDDESEEGDEDDRLGQDGPVVRVGLSEAIEVEDDDSDDQDVDGAMDNDVEMEDEGVALPERKEEDAQSDPYEIDEISDHEEHTRRRSPSAEDRTEHKGLEQDVRQPDLPTSSRSDGVWTGAVENIDGVVQEGVGMDEVVAMEEDDKDSQHDPEYSADEREDAERVEYADDDRGGLLPPDEDQDATLPASDQIYADQIPTEAQTAEDIEKEIQSHEPISMAEDGIAVYTAEREEYDNDDGSAMAVDGIPPGHEDDEVVDETDPKDLEMMEQSVQDIDVLQQPLVPERSPSPDLATISENVEPQQEPPLVRSVIDTPEESVGQIQATETAAGLDLHESADLDAVSIHSDQGNESDNEDNDQLEETSTVVLAPNAMIDPTPEDVPVPTLLEDTTSAAQEASIVPQDPGYSADDEMPVEAEKALVEDDHLPEVPAEQSVTERESPVPDVTLSVYSATVTVPDRDVPLVDSNVEEVDAQPNIEDQPLLTTENLEALQSSGTAIDSQPVMHNVLPAEGDVRVVGSTAGQFSELVSSMNQSRADDFIPIDSDGDSASEDNAPLDETHEPVPDHDASISVIAQDGEADIEPQGFMPQDGPRSADGEDEDMFAVGEDMQQPSVETGAAVSTDLLEETVMGLSSPASRDLSPTPHSGTRTVDPVLKLQPAILLEHHRRDEEHASHPQEEKHVRAFEQVTNLITDTGALQSKDAPAGSRRKSARPPRVKREPSPESPPPKLTVANRYSLLAQLDDAGDSPEESEAENPSTSIDETDRDQEIEPTSNEADDAVVDSQRLSSESVDVDDAVVESQQVPSESAAADEAVVEPEQLSVSNTPATVASAEPSDAEAREAVSHVANDRDDLVSLETRAEDREIDTMQGPPVIRGNTVDRHDSPSITRDTSSSGFSIGPKRLHPEPPKANNSSERHDVFNQPATPPRRLREMSVQSTQLTHHHHGSTHMASSYTLNNESPASGTRSHCVYHKVRFGSGRSAHNMLIPRCAVNTNQSRSPSETEDLGPASQEEMKRRQNLMFGDNFTERMKTEEEGTLPATLQQQVSLLVGRELIREGQVFILPLEDGVPHIHDGEDEAEAAISSRTRRKTSQTPSPQTPMRGSRASTAEPDKKRKRRESSTLGTPRPSKLFHEMEKVKEEEEEEGEEFAESEGPSSSKKRIVDVDGSPKAVKKEDDIDVEPPAEQQAEPIAEQYAERDRDDEDGDMMDVDERVEREHGQSSSINVPTTTESRKTGWLDWIWGRK